MSGNIAPDPRVQERTGAVYERKMASNTVRRGPLRFEEGVATDTDVPNEFTKGAMQGYITAPGSPNHNANVYIKTPAETMQERDHVGSASWVEAPTFLGEFGQGSFSDYAKVSYEQVDRSGGRYERLNPAVVSD